MIPDDLISMINKKLAEQERDEIDVKQNYEPRMNTFVRRWKLAEFVLSAFVVLYMFAMIMMEPYYETLIYIALQWSFIYGVKGISQISCEHYAAVLKAERLKVENFRDGLSE